MNQIRQKYYPTILQAIHLIILYIFIQTVVDFPLALIDYYQGTDYLYNPVKKVVLGVGSTLFILIYGFRKTKSPFLEVFPMKFFNPLIIIPIITFLWAAHNWLGVVNKLVETYIPPPPWFWELFNKVFESDYGWWGTFLKVAVIAPVVEELIFRGLILHGLRRNYNAFTAVVISALLFALFHLNPWQFPATFVLGLLLGWVMIRTRNILLAIIGHSINNLLVLLIITYWPEINTHAIFLLEEKELLNLSLLLMLLSLVVIYLLTTRWNIRSNSG
ncbi:MAG: CPBP family intramembrane glutamic endopeptidase [Prolixibacteraceae bacterium]